MQIGKVIKDPLPERHKAQRCQLCARAKKNYYHVISEMDLGDT
jgi:hypothetical protein